MKDIGRLIWSVLLVLLRSRAALAAENLLLRQQINVLRRTSANSSSATSTKGATTVSTPEDLLAQSCRWDRRDGPLRGAFRLLFGFLILRHGRSRILWVGVTAHPTADWIARQLTEAFGIAREVLAAAGQISSEVRHKGAPRRAVPRKTWCGRRRQTGAGRTSRHTSSPSRSACSLCQAIVDARGAAKTTTDGNTDVAFAAHIDRQADRASREMRVRDNLVRRIAGAERVVSMDVNRHGR
jgi:hypothetical protein